MKSKLKILTLFFVSAFFLFSCNQSGSNFTESSNKSNSNNDENKENSELQKPESDFNLQDKDALSSGNISVAYSKIADIKPEYVLKNIFSTSISKITKSPYSHIGKFVKLYGTVYKVEELPPDASRPGTWVEALLLLDNPNSPLGSTTVDFIYNGDINKINANSNSTIAGYYCGNYFSTNAYGGEVEAITVVGNYCSSGLK